jgi:hypothetical protein
MFVETTLVAEAVLITQDEQHVGAVSRHSCFLSVTSNKYYFI